MKNNGWEFVLNANRIAKVNKFSLDLNMSFADNKNEITKMDPTLLESLNRDFDRQNGSYLTRVQLNNMSYDQDTIENALYLFPFF